MDINHLTRIKAILFKSICLCAFITGLLGCSVTHTNRIKKTSTEVDPFIPPHATAYQLQQNQKIVLGEAIAQAAPRYPPALASKPIPQRNVCLEIEIDEQGRVYVSRPLYGIPGCPQNAALVEPEFIAAAQRSVLQWRFQPTYLCTFPPGVDAKSKDNSCAGADVKTEPLAIRLAFNFTYLQTSNGPTVKTGSLHAVTR